MFALHTLHFCCVFCFAFVCILYFGVNFLVLFLEFGKEKEKLSPAACRANLTHHEKKKIGKERDGTTTAEREG